MVMKEQVVAGTSETEVQKEGDTTLQQEKKGKGTNKNVNRKRTENLLLGTKI